MMAALGRADLHALVAPFLISCAVATGDPFYAINYHTSYYRFGEGLPAEQPKSAASYLSGKLAGHPVRVLDTVLVGLSVQPFATKFHGYEGFRRASVRPYVVCGGGAVDARSSLPAGCCSSSCSLHSYRMRSPGTWPAAVNGDSRCTRTLVHRGGARPRSIGRADLLAGCVADTGVGRLAISRRRRFASGMAALVVAVAGWAACTWRCPGSSSGRTSSPRREDVSIETRAAGPGVLLWRDGPPRMMTASRCGCRLTSARPRQVPAAGRGAAANVVVRLDPVAPGHALRRMDRPPQPAARGRGLPARRSQAAWARIVCGFPASR